MFLGLDLGTTNVKALVVDPAGRVVAEGSAPVGRACTPDGGVEQDIATIWDAACAAIRAAVGAVEATQVRALGISSQGAALQVLDSHDSPCGPVISWLDGRGRPFDEQLTAELGAEFFIRHLGRTPCTMTPGQVLRLRQQHPEQLPPTARLGWVGDVIVGRFCGRRAHDATSLSIAMLYNPWQNAADAEVLARIGFREDQLPELLPATTPAGRLTPAAAQQTGLPAGIPVSTAIHDQYAGVLGAGSVRAGDVYIGTGTAWVLLANTAALAEPVARGTFVCRHTVDGLGGQMLSMTNGGSALDWVLSLVARADAKRQAVDEALAGVTPGSAGLCFWPLLAASAEVGLGRSVGGRLDGLTLGHTPQHLIRAAVEGLACELVRHLRLLTDAGLPVHRLILCGGAAASEVTPQIIADLAERPVACVTEPSVSALGAAVIARTLVEPDASLPALAERLAPHCRTVAPGPAATVYRQLLERYLEPFGPGCPR
jgi:sugar (pentulose or hexulose) kinase